MAGGKSGRIQVAAVGKIKKSGWQSAQADYVKRLKRYTAFALTEVKDVVGRGLPDSAAIQREGEALLKATGEANRRILLAPTGRAYTSKALAKYLRRQIELYGHLAFLVGGPVGFDAEVVATADDQLSLSPLTFPHELARIMLLEQLYRAFTIMRGEPYHK